MIDDDKLPDRKMALIVGAYSNAVGRYGPDSVEARSIRESHVDNPEAIEYFDALDRVKLNLGGSGIDYSPRGVTP